MLLRAEADIFKATLSRCATTREAARALGVNQSTVVRKARLHGLTLRTAPEGSGRGPARKKGRGNARTAGIARLG
jgi:transposase-like protein